MVGVIFVRDCVVVRGLGPRNQHHTRQRRPSGNQTSVCGNCSHYRTVGHKFNILPKNGFIDFTKLSLYCGEDLLFFSSPIYSNNSCSSRHYSCLFTPKFLKGRSMSFQSPIASVWKTACLTLPLITLLNVDASAQTEDDFVKFESLRDSQGLSSKSVECETISIFRKDSTCVDKNGTNFPYLAASNGDMYGMLELPQQYGGLKIKVSNGILRSWGTSVTLEYPSSPAQTARLFVGRELALASLNARCAVKLTYLGPDMDVKKLANPDWGSFRIVSICW